MNTQHTHKYKEEGNYNICKCGKKILRFKNQVGTKSNGVTWSKKENQNRFLFPDEWIKLTQVLKPKALHTGTILLNTGVRHNEGLKAPKSDLFYNPKGRSRLTIRFVKTKARKGEFGQGKMRQIPLSKQFAKYLKGYKSNSDTFDLLSNSAFNRALKKAGKEVGIEDYNDLSAHTMRKTFEVWLMALNVGDLKVVAHLGHSISTAASHYISPDIFSWDDITKIRRILGDIYEARR
jgi:integrase